MNTTFVKTMIVTFVTDDEVYCITGCPDTYKSVTIKVQDNNDNDIVIKKKLSNSATTTVVNNYDAFYEICEFFDYQELTENVWKFFMDHLGFIPFYDKTTDVNLTQRGHHFHNYIELPHYDKLEDLYAMRQPTKMMELLGVQIPVAIFNEMRTLTNMKETTGSIDVTFPPEIESHVEGALRKIMTVIEDYTLEDMLVYNFLDMLHLFRKNTSWFISGDKLHKTNTINLYKAGYVGDGPSPIYFIYAGLDSHVDAPDTIIAASEQYQKIEKRYRNISPFKLKALKLFASQK